MGDSLALGVGEVEGVAEAVGEGLIAGDSVGDVITVEVGAEVELRLAAIKPATINITMIAITR